MGDVARMKRTAKLRQETVNFLISFFWVDDDERNCSGWFFVFFLFFFRSPSLCSIDVFHKVGVYHSIIAWSLMS